MRNLTYIITASAVLLSASCAQAETIHIKGANKYGCTDKAVYDKTGEMVAQNDKEAFAKLLSAAMASGICTLFSANEQVYVTDAGLFTSKVRRKGDVAEYWITTDALSR